MKLKLTPSYFQQQDVVHLVEDLLGKTIHTHIDNKLCVGIISETEAYAGVGDKACHAHLGRFTKRTKVMYEAGGIAYVYLCYGIHYLYNIVCNQKGVADVVLLRGVIPTKGIETMLQRRKKAKVTSNLTTGPGNFTQAFGISKKHNETSICGKSIWMEDYNFQPTKIETTPRIGIAYAEDDALLPWRFVGHFDDIEAHITKRQQL